MLSCLASYSNKRLCGLYCMWKCHDRNCQAISMDGAASAAGRRMETCTKVGPSSNMSISLSCAQPARNNFCKHHASAWTAGIPTCLQLLRNSPRAFLTRCCHGYSSHKWHLQKANVLQQNFMSELQFFGALPKGAPCERGCEAAENHPLCSAAR